jgi:hypothetical protein
MDIVGWLVIGGILYAFYKTYKSGKREGSRKGYHAGRMRRPRQRRYR